MYARSAAKRTHNLSAQCYFLYTDLRLFTYLLNKTVEIKTNFCQTHDHFVFGEGSTLSKHEVIVSLALCILRMPLIIEKIRE
jgi:hypothetical protein